MGWNVNDLTQRVNAPRAVFSLSGYVFEGESTQHVVYQGFTSNETPDGHVHELNALA